MAPRTLEFDASNLTPLSIASLCSRCSHVHSRHRTNAFNCLNLSTRPNFRGFRFRTEFNCSDSQRVSEISRGFKVKHSRRVITDVARAEQPEKFDEFGITDEEVNRDTRSSLVDSNSELRQKKSQLRRRVIFGLAIGLSGGGVALAGGWVFTLAISVAVFVASREYFELTFGRYAGTCCLGLAQRFDYYDVLKLNKLVSILRGIPRFAQLSSTMFGLFYCGYLPCFWVKLRCGLAAPALNTRVGASWPLLLGGQAQWTVGLVATLISISCIIAADTYAFFGGKAFGRTPLTAISPKKTWEGALVGLGGCIATSVLLANILCWPSSTLSATAFGILIFFGSIFGDLTESMIKRDAGVKDSGSLIPGHGGILDRIDSYIFTGALTHSFVKTFLPLYGV